MSYICYLSLLLTLLSKDLKSNWKSISESILVFDFVSKFEI